MIFFNVQAMLPYQNSSKFFKKNTRVPERREKDHEAAFSPAARPFPQ